MHIALSLAGKRVGAQFVLVNQMKNRKHCVRMSALVMALTAVYGQAQAQTATLKETVVTATRNEQPLADVISDVTIIDRAQLDKQPGASLMEVLGKLGGMQSTNYGDQARVFSRGAEPEMTALYIDGVRVDSHDGFRLANGGAPWAMIPLSQIDRIEILRGPASAIYGSDAMGGVVQIFTRKGTSGFSPFVAVEVGSMKTAKINTGFSGAANGWDYSIGYSHEASDYFDTRPDLIHTPNTEKYNQHAFNVKLGYQINRQHKLEFVGLENKTNTRYVLFGGGTDAVSSARVDNSGVNWSAAWSDVYSTKLSYSQGAMSSRDDQGYDFKTHTRSTALDNRWQVLGGTVNALIEQKQDEFSSTGPFDVIVIKNRKRTQDAYALGYGARFGVHSVQVNLRHDKDELFGSKDTSSAGYAYQVSSTVKLMGSYSTGFRAPTLYQIYGDYGDRNLKPETSQNREVGISYDKSGDNAKLVAYRNRVSNLISTSATVTTCSAGFFCYYNVGQATLSGATLSGRTQWMGYALSGSMDWLSARNDANGKFLNLRAAHSATLSAERKVSSWNLGLETQLVGHRYSNAANTQYLAGYALLNVRAQTAINRDWTLSARVENLANRSYQQVDKYVGAPRGVFVNLKWQPNN
jgi:vitamin B12 transporter